MARIEKLLERMLEMGGSDLHVSPESPPLVRSRGELIRMAAKPMPASYTEKVVQEVLTPEQWSILTEGSGEVDFSFSTDGIGRFRCNAFHQRRGYGAVFHLISSEMPRLADLQLPEVIHELCRETQGMILVTGPRGCGKSTTQAAMIDYINSTREAHILTIEDPIEFIHENKKSLVNQREVGSHTRGFAEALRQSLRADPDIILVGEMRDLETISTAVTAAETGHLVLGTLHTLGAVQTVDRIIDVFPSSQRAQIRLMVSDTLRGIISQQLIPVDGGGSVLAAEILIGNQAVSNLIREGKSFQIPSVIQMNSRIGMQLMDDALAELVRKRKLTYKQAMDLAVDRKKLAQLARRRPT